MIKMNIKISDEIFNRSDCIYDNLDSLIYDLMAVYSSIPFLYLIKRYINKLQYDVKRDQYGDRYFEINFKNTRQFLPSIIMHPDSKRILTPTEVNNMFTFESIFKDMNNRSYLVNGTYVTYPVLLAIIMFIRILNVYNATNYVSNTFIDISHILQSISRDIMGKRQIFYAMHHIIYIDNGEKKKQRWVNKIIEVINRLYEKEFNRYFHNMETVNTLQSLLETMNLSFNGITNFSSLYQKIK